MLLRIGRFRGVIKVQLMGAALGWSAMACLRSCAHLSPPVQLPVQDPASLGLLGAPGLWVACLVLSIGSSATEDAPTELRTFDPYDILGAACLKTEPAVLFVAASLHLRLGCT